MEQQDRLHSLDAVRARQRSTKDRMASRCVLSAAEGLMRLDTKRVAVLGKPSQAIPITSNVPTEEGFRD